MNDLTQALKPGWTPLKLTNSFLMALGLLILWFIPGIGDLFRALDYKTFHILNQSLLNSNTWQIFWGYLNHPNESWLNFVWMLSLNIIGALMLDKNDRPRAFAYILYFWFCFQIVLFLNHALFTRFLHLQRSSPSLIITPWVVLSETLNISGIKDYSNNSFPAGHVLVLVYWTLFTSLYAPRIIKTLTITTLALLAFPRLFSGAHWATDIIFTVSYAYFWYVVMTCTPIYAKSINYLTSKFK